MMTLRFEKDGTHVQNVQMDTRDPEIQPGSKPFSSGAAGYFAAGKVVIDGKRYQVSCSVVEIGSKGRHLPE